MQLRIKLGQLFTKNNFVVFVSTIIFIVCAASVVSQGYRCFDKYLMVPENSEVSYKSSKNYPFPSITLCASLNDSYNFDQLKECQVEPIDYIADNYIPKKDPSWVGKGGINCTDPKRLHNQIAADNEEHMIETIVIKSRSVEDSWRSFQPSNWSSFEWEAVHVGDGIISVYQRCFTFSLPDDIVRESILYVGIVSKAFDTLYLHRQGTLSAPIPGNPLNVMGYGLKYTELYSLYVTHESIELLNYDGENCNNDREYSYDKCKQDYIYKV